MTYQLLLDVDESCTILRKLFEDSNIVREVQGNRSRQRNGFLYRFESMNDLNAGFINRLVN